MDRVLDGFTTCLNFTLSDRAPPDKIALAEGGTVLFETRSIDTNSTVPPSASAILSGGARSLSVKFKHVVIPPWLPALQIGIPQDTEANVT